MITLRAFPSSELDLCEVFCLELSHHGNHFFGTLTPWEPHEKKLNAEIYFGDQYKFST